MNGYGRLSAIQRDLAGVRASMLIMELIALRDEVSREFDRATSRHMYSVAGTRYYSGDGRRRLYLGDDLIAVTTLKLSATADQPSTFDYTLAAGTDYTLWPRNAASRGEPYRAVDLNPGGQFATWPSGADNIELVGLFGYSDLWDASGLTGTLASASDTTLVTSALAAGVIDPGDMLKIESEQIEVTEVTDAIVTVIRGRNGTVAAAHTGAAISVRRYPADVENVVKERTVGRRWDSQGGYDTAITLTGEAMGAAGSTRGRGIYARWRDACRDFVNPAAVL